MPRIEILENFSMGAVKGQEIEERDGETTAVETWTLIFVDRQTGDQIRVGFRREARDDIVRQLTGGIVLAGGELPRI
jgi:hypothetical protein